MLALNYAYARLGLWLSLQLEEPDPVILTVEYLRECRRHQCQYGQGQYS